MSELGKIKFEKKKQTFSLTWTLNVNTFLKTYIKANKRKVNPPHQTGKKCRPARLAIYLEPAYNNNSPDNNNWWDPSSLRYSVRGVKTVRAALLSGILESTENNMRRPVETWTQDLLTERTTTTATSVYLQ